MNLAAWVEKWGRAAPDRLAIARGGATHSTYRQWAARSRVLAAYRHIARTLPRLLYSYDLQHIPPRDGLRRIAVHFRANAAIRDPKLIDFLRTKAEMEIDEAVRQFKTMHHVLEYVAPPAFRVYEKPPDPKQSPFMQKFLKNQIPA